MMLETNIEHALTLSLLSFKTMIIILAKDAVVEITKSQKGDRKYQRILLCTWDQIIGTIHLAYSFEDRDDCT